MAKKVSAKEKREAERLRKQQQFKAADEKRRIDAEAEESRLKQEVEEKKKMARIAKLETDNPDLAKVKKSNVKASGMKSAFIISKDKMFITSFGNGAEAKPEKYVVNNVVTDAAEQTVLTVSPKDHEFHVSGRVIKDARATNPMYSKEQGIVAYRDDQIHLRSKLEKMYFGKEFEDNIHIQLIYQILDIEKILAVQSNNIVFAINNMLRREDAEYDDFIGYMNGQAYDNYKGKSDYSDKYQTFCELLNKPQLAYFGNTMLPLDSNGRKLRKGTDRWEKYEKKCYYLLAAMGMIRQGTVHGDEKTRAAMYRLELEHFPKDAVYRREMAGVLDELYAERIHELNHSFLDNSKKDLYIISQIYGTNDKAKLEELAKDYYSFIILKEYKYLGFSIKKLRETLIKHHADQISDRKYDSVRRKLNHILGFMIYRYYNDAKQKDVLERIVEQLRASRKDSEKELIYQDEAANVWELMGDKIEYDLLPKMDGNIIKFDKDEDIIKSKMGIEISSDLVEDVFINKSGMRFSELMYAMTLFLDGKEINDFLTQLINRFDNINSFLQVMEHEGLDTAFSERYKIFSKSGLISKELRTINSFARMTETDPNSKIEMVVEAAQLLGYEDDEEKLREYVADLMDQEKRPILSNGKKDNNFRNFIINNVIVSSRFKYLVRYGNVKKLRALAENRVVVDFVLKGIPDEQICAYYNSCNSKDEDYFPEMRTNLAEKITGLHFMDFSNVYHGNIKDTQLILDKERKKNIVRLYLTVLYLLLKNLVYVNSRYYMAFHCAERDRMIFDKSYATGANKNNWAKFAEDFLEKYEWETTKTKRYHQMQMNFHNADGWSLRAFRNCSAHLAALRNIDLYIKDIRGFESYFELYHYLVQRHLKQKFADDCQTDSKQYPGSKVMSVEQAEGRLLQYFDMVDKYHTYCKDFVKALCVPFAYNLARFKNLAINELFDRNNYLPNKDLTVAPEE